MFVNSDFSELLRLFNANQVRYPVIDADLLSHPETKPGKHRSVKPQQEGQGVVEASESLPTTARINRGDPPCHNSDRNTTT